MYDGVICLNTVSVRRIAFHGGMPGWMQFAAMRIIRYDDDVLNSYKNYTAEYLPK